MLFGCEMKNVIHAFEQMPESFTSSTGQPELFELNVWVRKVEVLRPAVVEAVDGQHAHCATPQCADKVRANEATPAGDCRGTILDSSHR